MLSLKKILTEIAKNIKVLNTKTTLDIVTSKAIGSIVHFEDGADSIPMKDVLVHIEPVQAGSGDPSLDNVRSITGWTGCVISHSGADMTNPTTYSITFPSSAGTVYGGTLDVTSGVLTVDRAFKVFNGSEDWAFSSTSIRPNIKITDMAYKGTVICNMYPYSSEISSIEGTISTNGGNGYNIWIKDSINGNTLENWKTFLATNNLQIVYELATSIIYTLTPQEITSLLGINNLWADTGDSEVEYVVENTASHVKKQIIDSYVTPEMFGAIGDGEEDDSMAIQRAINYAIKEQVSFKALPKIYGIGTTINILTPNEAQKNEFFDFGGCILKALSSMEAAVKVETSEEGFGEDIAKNTRVIKNLIIDCQEKTDYGIYHKMGRNLWYVDCSIMNVKNCAFYAEGQAQIDRMFIDRRMYNYQSVGMQLNKSDNKINNVRIRDHKTGVIINGNSSYLTGVHCWLINPSTIEGSRCFVVNSGNLHMTNCYADTYETSWVINVSSPIFLAQCKAFINPDFYNNEVSTNPPIIFASDTSTSILSSAMNTNIKMFGFEIDSASYIRVTGEKPILADGLQEKDVYGAAWNIYSATNKPLIASEIDVLPSVITRGHTVVRNLYTLSNALPLLRDPVSPTISTVGENNITIIANNIVNNGFSVTGFLRIKINSQTQAELLNGFPKPLKTINILGYTTGQTANSPNKIVHFIITSQGVLSVFGYSSAAPLSGEYIIPTEYTILSK